jgi:serine/threonine protein phosphatase PrpC
MVRFFKGDLFLVLSDGIHHTLTGEKLLELIEKHYPKSLDKDTDMDRVAACIAEELIDYARRENPEEFLSLAVYFKQ